MDLDQQYQIYAQEKRNPDKNLSHHEIRKLLGNTASNFSNSKESILWLAEALTDDSKKWFVADLMKKINPIPKELLNNLIYAALLEKDPSNNRFFIGPCVKTFGQRIVTNIVYSYKFDQAVISNGGIEPVLYWVPSYAV
ncbi:MAG: hypothetical protein HRU38_02810 [Saccharospirillaceae bacterium]|nr:hypothetical protein [Pseudomonadales bacterium]NRB77593.1 hypothetical protein [Saccharospirillaceae bacterium]